MLGVAQESFYKRIACLLHYIRSDIFKAHIFTKHLRMLFNLISFKVSAKTQTKRNQASNFLIPFVNNFQFVLIVYSGNVQMFSKKIFGNKFDLFWTTTFFLQLSFSTEGATENVLQFKHHCSQLATKKIVLMNKNVFFEHCKKVKAANIFFI